METYNPTIQTYNETPSPEEVKASAMVSRDEDCLREGIIRKHIDSNS